MFHTPAIELTKKQAKLMQIPILTRETKGEKEKELKDLKRAIEKAKIKYNIQGIVTGALASNYQAERIQKICDELELKCLNPLWGKNQTEYLGELIRNKFEIIITAVAAYPLNEKWIGRKIDEKFIVETKRLSEKFGINPAGEGGEFESLVLNCPLFQSKLNIKLMDIRGEGNSFRGFFE